MDSGKVRLILTGLAPGEMHVFQLQEGQPVPALAVRRTEAGYECAHTDVDGVQWLVEDALDAQQSFCSYVKKQVEAEVRRVSFAAAHSAVLRFYQYGGDLAACVQWIQDERESEG